MALFPPRSPLTSISLSYASPLSSHSFRHTVNNSSPVAVDFHSSLRLSLSTFSHSTRVSEIFSPVLILLLMFPFRRCVFVSHPSTSSLRLLDHRARRKSIATGKQPSMEVPPTAPIQPFRQSVSNPHCPRPRSLPPTLSLSLLPAPALGLPHTCGRRASGTPPHPFPPSLTVSPSPASCLQQQQWQQQQQKGSKRGPGTPPFPSSLPLSPSLSFTLPHSPVASSSSPPFLYWGGDWRAAGSSPVAGGTFIAPLPPFEVCDTNMADAETLATFTCMFKCSDTCVLAVTGLKPNSIRRERMEASPSFQSWSVKAGHLIRVCLQV